MSSQVSNERIILKYWHSWQRPDWEEMRLCLAGEIDFGGHLLSADDFLVMCQNGNPWERVTLLSSIFDQDGGALLCEGLDTSRKEVIRVGEFIKVRDGKIVASIACFGSGQPPL